MNEPPPYNGPGPGGPARQQSSAGQPSGQPHDPNAERSVLGSLLIEPRVIQTVGTKLHAEDFYLESHRAIFAAMIAVDEAGKPIDSVLVLMKLRELDLLEVAGGGAYLSRLPTAVPTAANVSHYVEIVAAKAAQRSVLAFATEIQHEARGEVGDIARFVDDVAQKALGLSTSGMVPTVVRLSEALRPAIDLAEKLSSQTNRGGVTGVPSGFRDLDKKTAGWQGSDLIILAARPGMGKTAFALNMLVNAAKDRRSGTGGVIFSLEMSKEQLATRLWCAESRVPMEKIRTGDLDDKVWRKLYDGVIALKDLPVFIDDTAAIPITEMMRKCRQLKHEHDIGIIMVDYLQLMSASVATRNSGREQQISEISRSLKALAKELKVPVIALSQLNRGVESRTDKRPMLSDLRESGAIEQDADIITFLYREDYYDQMKGNAPGQGGGGDDGGNRPIIRSADGASLTEVIIAKHRSGSTGKIDINFFAPYTLFTDLAPDGASPPDEPY